MNVHEVRGLIHHADECLLLNTGASIQTAIQDLNRAVRMITAPYRPPRPTLYIRNRHTYRNDGKLQLGKTKYTFHLIKASLIHMPILKAKVCVNRDNKVLGVAKIAVNGTYLLNDGTEQVEVFDYDQEREGKNRWRFL